MQKLVIIMLYMMLWPTNRSFIKKSWNIITKKFLKISKTANLWAVITPYHSSLSVFMTNNMPSGAKSIAKLPSQNDFLSSSSSSDKLVQIAWLFHDGFRIKQQHFHWAVHQPITFFQVWSHTRRFELLTKELWLPLRRHFTSSVRMRTNHLATKCNYSARLLN